MINSTFLQTKNNNMNNSTKTTTTCCVLSSQLQQSQSGLLAIETKTGSSPGRTRKKTSVLLSALLIAMFSVFCTNVSSQTISSYTFSSTAGTYTAAAGTTISTETWDDQSTTAVLPIGFSFNFGGTSFTTFGVNNNGWIRLGANPNSSYVPISSQTANNIIAPFAGDLQGQAGSSIQYTTTGSAPNRILTVQWTNYRLYGGVGQSFNFQIKLYETTQKVEFIYGTFTPNSTISNTGQVGIRNAGGYSNRSVIASGNWAASTVGAAATSSCIFSNSVIPTSGLTYTWTPPACSGTPNTPLASTSIVAPVCGQAIALTATGMTTGVAGLSNQWQVSSTPGGPYTNVVGGTGATSGSYTTASLLGGDYYYVLASTCTFSSTTTLSNEIPIQILATPPTPIFSTSTGLSTTGFTANWGASTGATSYILDVSTSNTFATWVAGFQALNVGNVTTYTVSGLSANTNYYFRVRATNGTCETPNATTQNFYTGYCAPVTTYGCADGDVIARIILNTLDNNSGVGCPSDPNPFDASWIANAQGPGYSDYTSNSALTTTLLPSTSYALTVYSGQWAEGYAAWIDYNDNFVFETSERIGFSNGQVAGSSSATFPITISCTPPSGVHRMRVRAMYGLNGSAVDPCVNNSYGEIEDYLITIQAPPACPSPGVLTSTGFTSTSASFTWTLGCSVATNYDFEYGPAGFTPGTGTILTNQAATIAAGSGSYTLTGLIANTSYDVYFRANCGGTQSGWSPMINVYTGHCIPSSTSLLLWLSNVTTTGGVTNFNNSSTLSVNGYGDYTATQSVSAVAGSSFSLSANYNVSGYYYFAKVWVDWNNDLDFNDAGETMYTTPLFSATMPFSASLTVPAGQANGNYRMRVRLDGGSSYNDGLLDPCGTYTYGETEDYTLSVVPNCSAAPANPVAAVTGTTPICYGLTTTMAATGSTLEGGISNQWAYSTTPGGPYTNFSGATGLNYTTLNNLTPNTYYIVLNSTCSFTSQSAASNEITFTVDGATSNFTMVPSSFCGVGGNSILTASPSVPGATYTWGNNGGSLSTIAGDNTTATLSQTSEFTLSVSFNGCSSQTTQSIGVYSFPSILPTATPSTICGGTSSLLETGLSAANFAAICITPAPETSPTMGYTDLVINGVANVPQTSGNLDDGGWGNIPLGFSFNFFGTNYSNINVGTNGVLQFGAYNSNFAGGLGDYNIGALPNTVDPLAAIFASAGDLQIGQTFLGQIGFNGSLRYWTVGAAPNRRFILDYQGFRYGNAAENVKFQVIIYETLGQVDVVVIENAATNNKTIGVNSLDGTIGAAAPNCAAVPNTPGYWQATTNTIPASSPQAFKFIPPVNYVYNWTLNGTPNPGQDQLNGAAVNTTSTTQSPLSSTNYQVYIQDPITNCTQIFQTPVIVLPTPVAPIAVDWTQCGTQVPQANVSCPTCTGNETFNWYTAATNGSLYQGLINENFNTGTTTGSLYGDAALTGARCVLTQNVASQNGALLLGSTGVNSNAYNINFDFQVGPSDVGYNGADGFSYSFGDDVDAAAVSPAAENGSGSKLKVGFVSFTNGGSTRGIYLMYNCTTDEQTPTTPGVVAYSNDISWKNTATPVAFQMTIDNTGQVNLSLNGNPIFTNVQLPANYLLENKATWLQLFKARTGDGFSRHAIDNVNVEAQPSQQFATIQQPVSTSATYYVQTIDGLCGSTTLTPVSITVNPAPVFGITSNITGCQNNVYPISVTAGLNDFTNFVWSPAGILFMDQALTTPYVAGTSALTVYFSAANAGVQPAISCSATDGGIGSLQCGASASMTFTVQANPLAPTIASGVQAVCSGNTTSLDIQSNAAAGGYCPSAAQYTGDEEITNVTIGTLNQTSDCFTPGTGAASVLEKYADYTSGAGAPAAPSITAGTTVAGSVTVSSCGSPFGFINYTSGLAIFIDLNQDGDFTDAGEKVYSNGGVDNIDCVPATDVPVSLVIPANALNGTTRMRVINRELMDGNTITPCGNQYYGEVEDYLVNITGGITYTYTWSPAVTGNATTASVTTLPLTTATTYTAVLNDGLCSSAPSSPITVAIAVTPVVTTTAFIPISGYCPSAATSTADEDIFNVTLGTMNNTSDCFTTAGGPGSILKMYSNFTSGVGAPSVPSLATGSTTTGSVTVGSCGTFNYTSGLAVFIDFNQDGDFTDVGEKVFSNGAAANINCVPATVVPISITVPATAVAGQTRMRVVNFENNSGNNITPCLNSSWGETEDYLVNITGGAVNTPCPGSTFNLSSTATNGGAPYSYAWTVLSGSATLSSANIANPTAVVNTDATLQLTVTDLCGSVVTSTVVADIAENTITITPVNPTICLNDSITLTAANGNNFTWSPTSTLSTSTAPVVVASPLATTTYTIDGIYGIGCPGQTTITVTVKPLPIINAGTDQAICINASTSVSGSGGVSYSWNNNVVDGISFSPASTGTYTVVGVGPNGCSNQDSMVVVVNPLPIVNAGPNYSVCDGQNITLAANTNGTSVSWNNGVVNGFPFTPIVGSTTYTVTATSGFGCQDTDSTVVTVNPLPSVSVSEDQSTCAGSPVVFTATVGSSPSGSWTTNGQGSIAPNVTNTSVTYTPSTNDPGTVLISYAAFNACGITTDTATVTVLPSPAATVTPLASDPLTLVASPSGQIYQWIDCATGLPIADATTVTYTATQNGTYAVLVTSSNGCSDQSDCATIDKVGLNDITSLSITVSPNPTNGNVTVSLPTNNKGSLSIYDVQGRLVRAVNTLNNGDEINLSTFTPGMYTFKITFGELIHIERIIKN